MKTNPNEPAYPITEEETDRIDEGIKIYSGLTKREHFAAMAMQGLCLNPHIGDEQPEDIARFAVDQADALIEALNEEKP